MIPFKYLLISLLFSSAVLAQNPAPADEHAADRAALRELGDRYAQAINEGDLRLLGPFVTPTASAVFATNDEVQGIEAMQQYFDSIKARLGQGSSYTVVLKPDRSEFFGDIALAHGSSDETARLGSGRQYHFATHWTAILRKDGAAWKAHRLHVSMDPLDNPAIAARLQIRTWTVVAIAALAVAVAFAAGRATVRRLKGSPQRISVE
jgi:ketosteroid isomerase-like protein